MQYFGTWLISSRIPKDDVADYRDVDPKIGTLADFDVMVQALKKAGIMVIVDIVPNHTSDDHVWFQAALKAGKGSPEREKFIFKRGQSSRPPSCTTIILWWTLADPPQASGPTRMNRRPTGKAGLGGHLGRPRGPMTANGITTCSIAPSRISTGPTPTSRRILSRPCGSGGTRASRGYASTSRTPAPKI